MIKIYTVASCSSCKKAKEWLEKQNLVYQEINLVTSRICKEDILEILALTEEGTGDIISRRSQAYQRLNIDFERVGAYPPFGRVGLAFFIAASSHKKLNRRKRRFRLSVLIPKPD